MKTEFYYSELGFNIKNSSNPKVKGISQIQRKDDNASLRFIRKQEKMTNCYTSSAWQTEVDETAVKMSKSALQYPVQ